MTGREAPAGLPPSPSHVYEDDSTAYEQHADHECDRQRLTQENPAQKDAADRREKPEDRQLADCVSPQEARPEQETETGDDQPLI